MFFTYVLYSEKYDKIYTGYTSDLDNRIKSHNVLATKGWTIRYRPWKLLYYEKFPSKQEAIVREKELKSHQGRNFIRSLIRNNSNEK